MSSLRRSPRGAASSREEANIGDGDNSEPYGQASISPLPKLDDTVDPYIWFLEIEQLLKYTVEDKKKVMLALSRIRGNRVIFARSLEPPLETWERFKLVFMEYFVDKGRKVIPGLRLTEHAASTRSIGEKTEPFSSLAPSRLWRFIFF